MKMMIVVLKATRVTARLTRMTHMAGKELTQEVALSGKNGLR